MNEQEVFRKFRECKFNDNGYCKFLEHNVGVNSQSILCHCKDCRRWE